MIKKNTVRRSDKKNTRNDYYGSYDAEKTLLSTYVPAAFEKIRKDFGLGDKSLKTSDENRLKKQQENFSKKHLCPVCGSEKTFIKGTNVMVCQNPDCKGLPVKDKDGEIVGYDVPFTELNNRSEAIASVILG